MALKTMTDRLNPFKSSRRTTDRRLGTHVLGSIQGEGKFLNTGDLTDVSASIDVAHLAKERNASTES